MEQYNPTKIEKAIAEWKLKGGRRYSTIKKLCENLGIKRDAYAKINKDPNFIAYCGNLAATLMKSSELDVTVAMIDSATGKELPGTTDRKMYFEMMNKYTQKIEVTTIAEEITEMSTVDLVNLASSGED